MREQQAHESDTRALGLRAFDANDIPEYAQTIIINSIKSNVNYMPYPNYINRHPNLKWRQRSVILDWLFGVFNNIQYRYDYSMDTYFITVNIFDRFLSLVATEISANNLQLIGAVSFWMAAKYEERYHPTSASIAELVDDSNYYNYTLKDILDMEKLIFKTLSFKLNFVPPLFFIRRLIDNYDDKFKTKLSISTTYLSVNPKKYLRYSSSVIAASVAYISMQLFNAGEWDVNMIYYSGGYAIKDLKDCISDIIKHTVDNSTTNSVHIYKIFKTNKYYQASQYMDDNKEKLIAIDNNLLYTRL